VDKDLRKTAARMSKRSRKRAPPKDESGYFYICEECGQAVDKRSVAQIFHHEELSHLPLTEAELTELSLMEEAWLKSSTRPSKK
jgi:non-homologous end joining protein Ku